MCETSTKIHVFEKAKLGLAPFRWMGVSEKRGPIRMDVCNGVVMECGAPGQPMGTCDFCGTGIAECHHIRSSDGKEFIVGCECVRKTGDRGIIDQAERAANKLKNSKRHDREFQKIHDLETTLRDPDIRTLLESLPHPQGFKDFKTQEPLTAWNYVEWMMRNSGNAGKLRVMNFVGTKMKESKNG